MNKIKYIFVLGLASLMSLVTSCDYGDLNVDPTRPSDVSLALTLPTALAQAAFNNMASNSRLSAILMQHYDGFDAQQVDFQQYNLNSTTLNNYWNFGLYSGVMKDCYVMIQKGNAQEQPHYVGIAKILMAEAVGQLAVTFGDAPYSQAFLGTDNLKPGYDSQEVLYDSIQSLLDQAITALSGPGGDAEPTGASDLIYGGDAAAWILTAHAFKARYYMHLTKRDPAAHTKASAQVALSFGSNADQPDFVFDDATAFSNPLAQFGDGRPNTIVMNPGFVTKLAGDPRAPEIHDGSSFYTGGTGLFWSSNASPSPLISYSEIMFIEAEARILAGQGAAADAAMRAAIQANMDYLGVDGTIYMNGVPDISGMAQQAAVSAIMDQSYRALYGQAEVEVWTNYRRTGFPVLVPNPNGSNGNNPSGVLPRRIIYPQNERVTNEANLDAAIANQGGALLDDDLWAFK